MTTEGSFCAAKLRDAGDRRFTQVDPVKGNIVEPMTMTPYIYVVDNPLKYVDPDGKLFGLPTIQEISDSASNAINNITENVSEGWNDFTEDVSEGWNDFTEDVSEVWND